MAKEKFSNPPNQSAGILDDFAVRKNVATREGTIEHTPTLPKHITNKEYVDDTTVSSNFINGSMVEAFDALVSSDGITVDLTVSASSGSILTLLFSDGKTNLANGSSIELTTGSDAAPQKNYIYIPQSTKVLTKSTTGWPSTEHNKIGFFLVPSATFVQSNGCYINQNWNDALNGDDLQGHLLHITEALRRKNARYFSGISGAGTSEYLTAGAGTTDLKTTSGVVYQLHEHNFPAIDTSAGDEVLVKNWFGDAFHNITDLYDIVADSAGVTIGNNKFFNLVIWGVANKTGEYQPAMINLPGGFYNTQAAAEQDIDGLDDFDMSRDFNLESSTGFLIARITIQMKTGGGTWIVKSTNDLRGISPSAASGGVASQQEEFTDNLFRILNVADESKEVAFDVSGISAATVRTVTMPDADIDLGDIATNNAKETNATHTGDVTGATALTIGSKKVTLGMMADGIDGELITYNSSGVAAKVAVGTADQVLTSNGAGAAPTFQTAGGGADKQYIGAISGQDFDITVSGATLSSVPRAVAIPYQTSDGAWRLRFNAAIVLSVGDASFNLIFSGTTYKSGYDQATSATTTQGDSVNGKCLSNSSNIQLDASRTRTAWSVSGDVELNAKPSWAD